MRASSLGVTSPYTVLRCIGSGSFGSVILLRIHSTQALAALKVVPVYTTGIDTDMEHVWLRAMCSGDVPFTIHSLGSVRATELPRDLVPYTKIKENCLPMAYFLMLMPFVDGMSMRDYFIANPMRSFDRAAITRYAGQLAMFSYSAYHLYGMVHADIKLGNIVMARDGTLRVVDYTFAVQPELESEQESTMTWQRGTVSYLPPEKLFFETPPSCCMHPGGRSCADIWCIGTVIANMALSGRPAPVSTALPDDERRDTCNPEGTYGPARTDSIYYMLSDLRPWFANVSVRMAQHGGLDIEFVRQAIRIVLWTRALHYPDIGDPRRLTSALPTNEHIPGIQQTELYCALAVFMGEIMKCYDGDGLQTFERIRAALLDTLGPDLFRVYVGTQSWFPDNRSMARVYRNPFHWLALATGNVPPATLPRNVGKINPMAYPMHNGTLASLIDTVAAYPCETCGGAAKIYCNVCKRGRSCDAACYAKCHAMDH